MDRQFENHELLGKKWKNLSVKNYQDLFDTLLLPNHRDVLRNSTFWKFTQIQRHMRLHVWNHMVPCNNCMPFSCKESFGTIWFHACNCIESWHSLYSFFQGINAKLTNNLIHQSKIKRLTSDKPQCLYELNFDWLENFKLTRRCI